MSAYGRRRHAPGRRGWARRRPLRMNERRQFASVSPKSCCSACHHQQIFGGSKARTAASGRRSDRPLSGSKSLIADPLKPAA
jgi:hypothetical protein